MKKNRFLSFFSLLLLMSMTSYAAIEHDLQSLQQHLEALESALIGKPPAGGGVVQQPPAGVQLPTIQIPAVPEGILDVNLAELLEAAHVHFQYLARDIDNFISILDNFVKFTQGKVNANNESAQLNDLVSLLENKIKIHGNNLKDDLNNIEKMKVEIKDPQQAAKVYGFLHGIHAEINKFLTYLDATWKANQQPWEQVIFMYRNAVSGVKEKADAAHHFRNLVFPNIGIIRLENIEKNLKGRLEDWKAKAEAAAPIGGGVQQPPAGGAVPEMPEKLQQELGWLEENYDAIDRIIEDEVKPALVAFQNAPGSNTYKQLKKVIIGETRMINASPFYGKLINLDRNIDVVMDAYTYGDDQLREGIVSRLGDKFTSFNSLAQFVNHLVSELKKSGDSFEHGIDTMQAYEALQKISDGMEWVLFNKVIERLRELSTSKPGSYEA